MNKRPAFKVPLQTELWFHLRRYEQPHSIGGPAEQQKTDGRLTVARSSSSDNDPSTGGRTAAAMASGQTPLQPCPRPRRRSRGEDKYKESATGTSRAASASAPTTGAVSPPADPHSDPPGRAEHRPPRRGAVPVQRQDRPEHERRPGSSRRLGRSSRAHGATTTLAAGGGVGSQAGEPNTLKLTTPAADQPRIVEVHPSRRASERPLPRTLKERLTHEPAWEVELRLSPASTPARMMNILEAEGGTKTAARLASPHPGAGGHRLG
jgi:hypothetical protein